MNKDTLIFEYCQWENSQHVKAFLALLNHYMSDPMGDYPQHDDGKQAQLVGDMQQHPTAEVLLMREGDDYVGMATTFVNYSTFQLKPYLYIHDVVVRDDYRGRGFGKRLIEELIEESKRRGYCKLTLEVRVDNPAAQQVYRSMGFHESEPPMLFWTCKL